MSKEYTEKELREAIIDCAGSYHPAVGGKYLSWKPWLHIRKTYTDEIDKLECSLEEKTVAWNSALDEAERLRRDRLKAIEQRDYLVEAVDHLVQRINNFEDYIAGRRSNPPSVSAALDLAKKAINDAKS